MPERTEGKVRLGRRVRLDTCGAVTSLAERVVRESLRGERQPAEAAALVAALRDLAALRGFAPGKASLFQARG